MARLLDRATLQSMASLTPLSSTSQTQASTHEPSSLQLTLDSTSVPHVHFSTVLPPSPSNSTPQASLSLTAQAQSQLQPLSSSDGTVQTRTPDLTQVLASLQSSGDLGILLQQQPNLLQELSTIAAGEVSSNPESLRVQYDADPSQTHPVTNATSTSSKTVVYKEQDRFLPIHNVARIMRNSVPKSGKVSKEAKECMQECVSEFVSFITSEASDKCIQEKRKTITGDDILFAMATLGFDSHIEPLRIYLQKYREYTKADKVVSPPQSLSETNSTHVVASTMAMNGLRPVVASIPSSLPGTQPQATITSVPTMIPAMTGGQFGITELSEQMQ